MELTGTDMRKKAMIEALEQSLGIVTSACKTVGIARQTHYEWYNEDEKYRKEVDDIADIAIDFAESKLHQNISEKDTTSIIFFLKCKGKKRGYVERTETDLLTGGEKMAIFVAPSPEIAEQINKRMAELHATDKSLPANTGSISEATTDNTQGGDGKQ